VDELENSFNRYMKFKHALFQCQDNQNTKRRHRYSPHEVYKPPLSFLEYLQEGEHRMNFKYAVVVVFTLTCCRTVANHSPRMLLPSIQGREVLFGLRQNTHSMTCALLLESMGPAREPHPTSSPSWVTVRSVDS
jgi:hypothetical protein